MEAALKLIPAPHTLTVIEGAGHDLKRGRFDLGPVIDGFMRGLEKPDGAGSENRG